MTDGWFTETLHRGYGQSFEIVETLVRERTPYQDLTIFQTRALGRVLVLDGAVQTTEADEFYYHEMIAHLPLFSQERARRVLIIGGGDGGTLREVLKHPSVEQATIVEIDARVVELSREHLPKLSNGAFEDPRTHLIIGDGTKFAEESADTFDAIIVDSTDPIGPSIPLFEEPFYRSCAKRLDGRGVLIRQAGVPFFQAGEYRDTHRMLSNVFRDCTVALVPVPTYCGGHMALALASDDPENLNCGRASLDRRFSHAGIETRYYTPEIHDAALALPAFMKKALQSSPPTS
ncbi:MAG: polyamine aminopropyltransferase [Alphaproteobacteria bacterium]|nr:polyamine aminopropyltransferase [Alphaproteobacteria bacterium]